MAPRTRSAATLGAAALLVLLPSAARADQPVTPAGTGGGCQANGLELARNAQAPGPFGADVVRTFVPIAPLNALFFDLYC